MSECKRNLFVLPSTKEEDKVNRVSECVRFPSVTRRSSPFINPANINNVLQVL